MDILIIGNGFDLAHGLPTTYSDFLDFIDKVYRTKYYPKKLDEFKKIYIDNNMKEPIKKFLIQSFEDRINPRDSIYKNKNSFIQEIYDNVDYNIWFKFFKNLRTKKRMKGINWIDFESEISHVIELIDKKEKNIYSSIDSISDINDENVKIFINSLDLNKFKKTLIEKNKNNNYITTFRDLLDKTYDDLRKFIRCMEIYFSYCIENIEVDIVSTDILERLHINAILNFNYTHTFEKNYDMNGKIIHYIHGEAQLRNDKMTSNMVLGIDEYRSNGEQDLYTNYNIYKKFTQRIINETGFKYREWVDLIKKNRGGSNFIHHIYIFGHSLDITDKDILHEFIINNGVQTVVFYHDKQQQSQQIANLVKMIGQDNFINKINSVPPSIIFIKQQDMKVK